MKWYTFQPEPWYTFRLTNTLPEAEIIADKYHYVRQMEWMIREVRIRFIIRILSIRNLKSIGD